MGAAATRSESAKTEGPVLRSGGVTAEIDRNPRPSNHNLNTSRTSNTGTSLNARHTAFRVETRTAVS